jgi:hypothetical protein
MALFGMQLQGQNFPFHKHKGDIEAKEKYILGASTEITFFWNGGMTQLVECLPSKFKALG